MCIPNFWFTTIGCIKLVDWCGFQNEDRDYWPLSLELPRGRETSLGWKTSNTRRQRESASMGHMYEISTFVQQDRLCQIFWRIADWWLVSLVGDIGILKNIQQWVYWLNACFNFQLITLAGRLSYCQEILAPRHFPSRLLLCFGYLPFPPTSSLAGLLPLPQPPTQHLIKPHPSCPCHCYRRKILY